MALTVRELCEIPYLRTRLIAGEKGADTAISWAHSIEMPEPWDWLERGDLLLTVGLGVPADVDAQERYVASLAGAGCVGIAIGEDMCAPPISDRMLAVADELGFPILLTAYDVPFIQVCRLVAAASEGDHHMRLVATLRVYDSLRAATVRSSSPAELLLALGAEIGCELYVCGSARGTSLIPGAPSPPDTLREAFLEATHGRTQDRPAITRVTTAETQATVVPVPARRHAWLIAVVRQGKVPPYAILQHVATVAALEVERLTAAREERRRLGAEVLAGLFDARFSPVAAEPHLAHHGLEAGPFAMSVARMPVERSDSLHHVLADRGICHMLLRRDDLVYCLASAEDECLDEIVDAIGPEAHTGSSDSFASLDGLPGALREARWALDLAISEGVGWRRYGSRRQGPGPQSIGEARDLVRRVLGPVIDYDEGHDTELLRTLDVFLKCNRSWSRAAAELFVHRQTLGYRLRRIEELMDCKLAGTATLAEIWYALQAHELFAT